MFANRLKLDRKTQWPAVQEILTNEARSAEPVAQAMMQLRQRVMNMTHSQPDADLKPVLQAYDEAARRMTGIETRAFQQVYAMLKPNQHGGARQAFDLLAGFYQQQPRGGGGGRAGGRGPVQYTRFETIETDLNLNRDQRRATKTILDEAQKTAAPIRDGLTKGRAAILAAIQAGKPQAEIDQAVSDYAAHATAMMQLEMTSLGKILQGLSKEQAANAPGPFFTLRGAFLENKWDDIPNNRGY
jgi:hypothetical protein